MGSKTRVVSAFAALLIASFALHYVLFGSLPIGAPQMLDSNLDGD